jgi:hypothetical protein
MKVRSSNSYLVKRAIKDAKEAQNFNPQMMHLGQAMMNSDIPAYMVIGAALIMIGAGMGGGFAGEIHSTDHANSGHGHYSPPVNDTPAPAAPAHAPVNSAPVQAYQAQAVVNNNSTNNSSNNSSHDYQPAKEVSTQAYEPKETKKTLEERVLEKTPQQPVVKATAHGRSTGDEGGAGSRDSSTAYDVKDISNAPSDNDNMPITDGQYVVWMKGDITHFNLCIKNIATGKITSVNNLSTMDIVPYDLGTGSLIIYEVSKEPAFYEVDKETGQMTKLLSVDGGGFVGDGNNILFQAGNQSTQKYELKLFDKQTQKITNFNVVSSNMLELSLSGSRSGFELEDRGKILNIQTGNMENISDNSNFIQKHIRVVGDAVYFLGSYDNGNNWDVYSKDLTTKQISQRTVDGGSKHDLKFDGKNAVWERGGDIQAYSVEKNAISSVTQDAAGQGSPWVKDGKIVFVDTSKGSDGEIFLATEKAAPTNQPPTLEDITDSTIDYNGTWEKPIVESVPDGD